MDLWEGINRVVGFGWNDLEIGWGDVDAVDGVVCVWDCVSEYSECAC